MGWENKENIIFFGMEFHWREHSLLPLLISSPDLEVTIVIALCFDKFTANIE